MDRSHTILSAASRTGTFNSLTTTNLPSGFKAALSYSGNDVRLDLAAALGLQSTSLPAGQQGIAAALNTFFNNGGTLPPGFVTLFGLTGAPLDKGLSQVSGEVNSATGQTGTQMMSSFMSVALNPFGGGSAGNPGADPGANLGTNPGTSPGTLGYTRDFGAGQRQLTREEKEAYAAVMPRDVRPQSVVDKTWSVWSQGYGGYNKTDGNSTAGTSDTTSRTWGFATGADHNPRPDIMVGFALAGGATSWNLAQGLGNGRSDVFQAGVYGSRRFGPAYVSGVASYSWQDITTERTVGIAGTDRLSANFKANSVAARVETGVRIATPDVDITPYAAGQTIHFRAPSYSEKAVSGSAQFALAYAKNSSTSYRTELGFWYDKTIPIGDRYTLALRGRTAWAHDFPDRDGGATATFQSLPGSTFIMNGAAAPTDLMLVTAGAELVVASRIAFGARFDGEWAPRGQTYAGTGTIRYFW